MRKTLTITIKKIIYLSIFFLLGLTSQTQSSMNSVSPIHIKCGFYPVSLRDFNLRNQTYKIDFYLWCLSKTIYNCKSIELINAHEQKIIYSENDKVGDSYRTNCRISATVQHDWDLRYYPFGSQTLKMVTEDFNHVESEVIFSPDIKNTYFDDNLSVEGWTVKGFSLGVARHVYKTNFGDPVEVESNYSQLIFKIDVKPEAWRLYFDTFLGFFIGFFLSAISYVVHISNVGSRISLMLAAIFSIVGNKYVMAQVIPLRSSFGLADIIQLCSFLMVVFTTLSIIYCHTLEINKKRKSAYKINKIVGIALSASYILIISIATYHSYIR
jgi:hypothetical protein